MTGADPVEVAWFGALCDDDYQYLGVPDPALASSWEHCRDITLAADRNGFDNILLPSGYTLGIDATAFAAGMAPLTERMRLLLAVRMGELWLPQLARQIATIDRMLVLAGSLENPLAVGDGRAQRLLHQHMDAGAEHVVEHRCMGHVRGGHHHYVAEAAGQQVAMVAEAGCGRCEGRGRVERPRIRVGHRAHPGAGQMQDVGDVLAAHHPGADDPVTELRSVHPACSSQSPGGPGSRACRLSQIA